MAAAAGAGGGAAAAALFDTVYDVLRVHEQAYYPGEHKIEDGRLSELYHEVSKLLTYFALADLRHDFEEELDIDIGADERSRQSIGLTQCGYICEAFYAVKSRRYIDLYNWAKGTFRSEMMSDKVAKDNFKAYMDAFFSIGGTFSKFRPLFNQSSYTTNFDGSRKASIEYNDIADKTTIAAQLTSDIANTALLVDSQTGNPMQNIFDYPENRNKASYIVNFATVLDASPKSSADAHTYLNVIIQKEEIIEDVRPVERQLSLFGPNTFINRFYYGPDQWTTHISISYSADQPSIDMLFSRSTDASVNALALVKVRHIKKEDVEAAIGKLKLADISDTNKICAFHQFKSSGDRFQALSVSKHLVNKIKYVLNKRTSNDTGSIVLDRRATDAGHDLRRYHIITFINDILNLYQNWLLQNNFIDTGIGRITYYESKPSRQKTLADVHSDLIGKKRDINDVIIHRLTTNIDITNELTLCSTLYEAAIHLNAYRYCQMNELFRHFIAGVPSDKTITDTITGVNYMSYIQYTSGSFYDTILKVTNTRISVDRYKLGIKSIMTALQRFNTTIKAANISSHIEDYTDNLFKIVSSIDIILSTLNIINYTQLFALVIIKLSNYKNINLLLEDKELFKNMVNMSKRTSLFNKKYSEVTAKISGAQKTKLDTIYKAVLTAISTFEYKNLESISTIRGKIVDIFRPSDPDVDRQMYNLINNLINIKSIQTIPDTNDILLELLRANGFNRDGGAAGAGAGAGGAAAAAAPAEVDDDEFPIPLSELRGAPEGGLTVGDYHPRGPRVFGAIGFPVEAPAAAGAGGGRERSRSRSRSRERTAQSLAATAVRIPFVSHPAAAIAEATEQAAATLKSAMDVLSVVTRSILGLRGGSRSRSRSLSLKSKTLLSELIKAVNQKIHFMSYFLNSNRYYGSALFNAEMLANTLLADCEALIKPRAQNSYIIIRSSAKEKEVKSRSRSRSRSEETSKQITSVVIALPDKLKTERHSVMFKSPHGNTQGLFKRQDEVKNKLIQQLIAFLWFGSSQNADMKKLEATLFDSLLPGYIDNHNSDAHYQLFWQPLLERTNIEYETFRDLFLNVAIPVMKSKPASLSQPPLFSKSTMRVKTSRTPRSSTRRIRHSQSVTA